jgi:hypothetical protein
LIAAGVELVEVSLLLGHSELRVTADLYSHPQKQTSSERGSAHGCRSVGTLAMRGLVLSPLEGGPSACEKPSRFGRPRLCDFGLSHFWTDHATVAGSVLRFVDPDKAVAVLQFTDLDQTRTSNS